MVQRTTRRHPLKRLTLALCLAALAPAAGVSPAGAAVTLGQLAPGIASSTCASQEDYLNPTVPSGNTYVVPATGGVTSWRLTSWTHNARFGDGQTLTMKVFRKFDDPSTYTVVARDGPRPLTGGLINTFATSAPVNAGDVLGLNSASTGNACLFDSFLSEPILFRDGDLADGASAAFTQTFDGRPNIRAVVEPSNAFTLGKLKRNHKKSTATLTVNVPNPGELTASGKGVKAASAGAAVISKTVAAGEVKLVIRAKGRQAKQLKTKGKVKLNVAVTYTPTGGEAASQTTKVRL